MANIEQAAAMLDAHLRNEEGERLHPYLCEARVPTIGVGATTYLDGRKVKLSDPPITKEQMDRMLSVEIDRYITKVMELVDNEATTHQLVGLVLLGYNIGLNDKGLAGSTVIKRHKAGDYAAAARAFDLWNKYRPGGPGTPAIEHLALTARRKREAAIYATDDDSEAPVRMPQAVEAESKPMASQINRSGVAALATGAVSLVAEATEGLAGPMSRVRSLVVDTLGVPSHLLLPIVLVVVGIAVLYYRQSQRKGGWA